MNVIMIFKLELLNMTKKQAKRDDPHGHSHLLFNEAI